MDQRYNEKEYAPVSGSGSDYSDISALEDDTDEFGRKLFQQYRQRRRVEANPDGRPQAFRKATRGPTLSERLGRPLPGSASNAANTNITVNGHARTASSGSTRSDPPLNIPQDWGRRDRRGSDWLRSRRAGEEEGTGQRIAQSRSHREEQGNNRYQASTRLSHPAGRIPLMEFEDEALGSIEHTPPSMRQRRTEETPSSMHHMNTTIQTGMDTDDPDFTAFSLLASTPPVNNRHRKIDEIAREERESFERRVTVKPIRELKLEPQHETRPQTAPPSKPEIIPSWRKHDASTKENQQPKSSAVTRPKEQTSLADRATHAVTFKNTQRHEHQRGDSYNLLRQLARISSPSPSPAGDSKDSATTAGRIKRETASQSPLQFKSEGNELEPWKTNVAVELPVSTETPPQKRRLEDAKTPVVTGAWVNTPITEKQHIPAQSGNDTSTKSATRSAHSHIKPAHAKSALADVMSNSKSRSTFGESTIQSLEDIIGADLDSVDALTQADRDQRQEELAMEAMNKHMQSARKSIKNANRGLRRVEKEMEHSQIGMESLYQDAQEPDELAFPAPPLNVKDRHISRCTHCGCNGRGHRSVWGSLWAEFRSCFYSWDRSSPYWVRFTWLGILCALWATWYLTENILCYNYCKPEYAENLEHWDITPDMPVYPFVIPTLLFRPLRWLWQPVFEHLAWWCGVWAQAWIGDDAVSPEPTVIKPAYGGGVKKAFTNTYNSATETVVTAVYSTRMAQSVIDAVDEVGSMWDDEFL